MRMFSLIINCYYSNKCEGDAVTEKTVDDAGPVQADLFAVDSGKKGIFPIEASSSQLNFFDNVHPQIPVDGLTELLGNLQPAAFVTSPEMVNALLHNSDFKPSLQEPVLADPFAVQSGQRDSYPEAAQKAHQNFFDNVQPQAPVESMSELHGNLQLAASPVTKAEGDVMLHQSDIEPSLQEPVQTDPFLVQEDSFLEEAPVSNVNFFDNEHQPQATLGGMSEHHGNHQPGTFPASPAEGDIMLHSSELEPPSQDQCEAVPQSMVPPGVQPNIPRSIVEQAETLQNMAFSKGNVKLHPYSDLDPAPSMMLPGITPTIPQASAQNSEPLQVVPPPVSTSIQQASVQHPEPLQDPTLSNNDLVVQRSDLGPPPSMVPPSVPTSTQKASFQKPEPVQASLVPPGNLPFIPQAYVQQPEQLQDMALLEGDIRLHGSDLEPPPSMAPLGIPQASYEQPEPPQDMALPDGDIILHQRDLESPPKMVPPGVPASIPQASVQQPDPVQSMAENTSADPDHNAHVKLPSHDKSLADSLDQKLSMDSPSGTFKPSSVVQPVQPPSLGKEPSERTLLELFKPAPVEQMQLHMPPKMEGQFQQSGKQESSVDGKKKTVNI